MASGPRSMCLSPQAVPAAGEPGPFSPQLSVTKGLTLHGYAPIGIEIPLVAVPMPMTHAADDRHGLLREWILILVP